MKKVLIITYYWPPSGGSGVQRWVKFAKYLPECGWEPVIYTPENPELIAVDGSLGSEVASVEVVRRKIVEPYNIYRYIFGRRGETAETARKNPGEVNPVNSQKKSLLGRIALWIRGNFFIPDPRCMWIRPSVRFLKKYLRDHPVDAIVSTGPPHSMHLIARRVAGATGIPWVADFRDPWTKMFYFKHLHLTSLALRRHLKLEKKVLDEASAVVAVSPPVQEDFRKMTSTRVELITNGFDEEDFEIATPAAQTRNDVEKSNDKFRIVHTGLFASDGNPTVLWKVLADLCVHNGDFRSSLEIRLAGKTDVAVISAIVEAGLGENLVDLGYQPHKAAVAEQVGASLLVLPLRKEPEYRAVLPGKVFEYMASGTPVLGIGQSDGAMAMILGECGAGKVCEWEDGAGMMSEIERVWGEWKEIATSPAVQAPRNDVKNSRNDVNADVMKYSRRNLTKEMANLLDTVRQMP